MTTLNLKKGKRMSTSEREIDTTTGYLYKDGYPSIELGDKYPDERDSVVYLQADIDMTQQLYELLYKKGLWYDYPRQDDGEEA